MKIVMCPQSNCDNGFLPNGSMCPLCGGFGQVLVDGNQTKKIPQQQ
ncbi:MAG: hypothetical protein JWO13_2927 [Acidobacteriales bacterium]|nr:hypothetical protein [Terriglobales bacterium]